MYRHCLHTIHQEQATYDQQLELGLVKILLMEPSLSMDANYVLFVVVSVFVVVTIVVVSNDVVSLWLK